MIHYLFLEMYALKDTFIVTLQFRTWKEIYKKKEAVCHEA